MSHPVYDEEKVTIKNRGNLYVTAGKRPTAPGHSLAGAEK